MAEIQLIISNSSLKDFNNLLKLYHIDTNCFVSTKPLTAESSVITILYSDTSIKRKLSRNAGRKEKLRDDSFESIDHVLYKIKTVGIDYVCNEYNVHKSTIYRRIQRARKKGLNYISK